MVENAPDVLLAPPAPDAPAAPDAPPPALDESRWATISADEAREIARTLPLGTRFALQATLTPVQRAFLERHGFLLFSQVASVDEVRAILAEIDRIEGELLAAGTTKVYGVPVWFGRGPDGRTWLQRLGFTSELSEYVRAFVRDPRFEPIRTLIGDGARIGDREKDGVVMNRYFRAEGSLRPNLAWHTDALRDLFYNRKMPGPMLNVGLHFERVRPEDGGLRLLPGTHTQGALSTLFRKIHFVTQAPDPNELAVETWPGDLTVHDGRMWHRVEASPYTGTRSIRHSMYVPYVVDAWQPKSPDAPTPLYMKLFDLIIQRRQKRLGIEIRKPSAG